MKLASFTDNSQSFLKYGDTNTFLHVQISEDGTFVDLTQALAVNVPVANDDGLLFTKTIDPTKLASGDSGIVDINFTSDDQNNLPPDDYYLEIWVTNHDGTIGIYPADENQLMFTITDNLTLITGDVVPAVAFDDFQNMFNTLQQQVRDAIANGLKGETGAKGDPGEGLDIKGRVDSVSELPTTANEGTGYLVNEELYVYTGGAWKDCGPIQGPQGIQGIQGKTGNGISSTTIQYQISNSATTTPTGTWSNSLIATTQANPFLWTQVTLNYDDGTSKSFYLVSSKGDKGDTGAKGQSVWSFPYNVGANVSGRWWSDLKPTPTTANPPKVGDTIVDLIGNVYQITNVVVGGGSYSGGTFDFGSLLTSIKGPKGDTGPVGAGLVVKGTVSNASQLPTTGNQEGYCYFVGTDLYVFDAGAWKNCGSVSPDLSSYVTVTDLNNGLSTKVTDNKDGTEQLNGVQVQPFNKLSDTIGGRNLLIGTATPASITGINSVNQCANTYALVGGMSAYTLYQKYGSTFTLSYDFSVTDTASAYTGSMQQQFNNVPWDIDVVTISSNNTSGHVIKTFSLANNSANVATGFQLRLDNVPTTSTITVSNMKLEKGSIATDWTPAPEDKVNVADMRTPASDVAGIEEVNAKQDKIGYTPADDSKVAHLSGANNFDTVPTVNNNPLLLASSLPSDLARTGQDQEFTGKNTFDVAPIDKTTGNPYITKDGVPAVPSTLADTTKLSNFTAGLQSNGTPVATQTDVQSAISTATANMVDSTKATNFTAGLQSGGIDVATAADLKSVADKAWRPLTLKNSSSGIILFKDNGNGTASLTGSANFTVAKGTKTLTPAITPPTGYIFTSLNWNERSYNNNGVWANKYMGSGSSGVLDSFDTIISNGVICFLGQDDNDKPITFSPSELTTVNNSTDCNPALVSISKV